MDPESSFTLIARAQAGDATALDLLLARYRPRLQRRASGRLPRYARGIADTEDLVQDALAGTFRNFKDVEQLRHRVRVVSQYTERRARWSWKELVRNTPDDWLFTLADRAALAGAMAGR